MIQGKYVSQFEEKVAQYVGTKHAIAVSSCGVGLEIALRATGITGKKFIVPTQTFVASVSCIYGIGSPQEYKKLLVEIKVNQKINIKLYASIY